MPDALDQPVAEPTVSAGLAKTLLDYAVSRSAPADELAKRAGICTDLLDDPDNRVPMANYIALMRAAKDLCADPALPLDFAAAVDMAEFSVVGLLANAAETMMDSFVQLNRYGQLVVEVDMGTPAGRFAIDNKNGEMWLVDTRKNPNDFYELTETTFTRMITGPRSFLPEPHVHEVHVTHPEPAHRAAYDRVWGLPVKFSAERNAMRMEPRLQSHRVRTAPRYAFGVLSVHADALLKELEQSKSARGRVEAHLMPILHTGEISMDQIAHKLGQSRQTLYRALKIEGVTFERVLDDLRHKLALHYLSGKKVSVNETAYLIGFSDPAAFSRAFKRWTGKSPREMRGV